MKTNNICRKLYGQSDWKQTMMRLLPAICMILFASFSGFAQDAGAGVGAFTSVETNIKEYIVPVRKLIYVIAAVISLVGAFNIYHKMSNGDQDVKKTIMLTIGGCIGLIAMATALPKFFGY